MGRRCARLWMCLCVRACVRVMSVGVHGARETAAAAGAQCYFVDGAASMKRDLSKPLANGVPVEKICQRVSKSTPEMCQLRFCACARAGGGGGEGGVESQGRSRGDVCERACGPLKAEGTRAGAAVVPRGA